jgi:hypothetical protein
MENLETKSRVVRVELDGRYKTVLRIDGTLSPEEAKEIACNSEIIQAYVGQYGKDRVKVIIYK